MMEIPDVLDHAADRPIQACKDDVLGRCSFAKAVAKGIAARVGKESYVIGLFGPWGSGKSSVKNMIVETLQSDEATCPIIVEFNPWQFKDAEQLTQAFFTEIAASLEEPVGSQSEIDENKLRAAKWKQLGSVMSVGGDAVTNIAKVAGFMGVPFAEVARSMGEAVKAAGGETKESAAALEAQPVRSLSMIKNELTTLMKGAGRPVLVVLDDIDRLSAAEMPLIFQLVKANGDFPNLVYLLLFQRDIVEASLNKIAPKESGADYLEKIIQLPLNLPAINRTQLFDLMKPDLVRILGQEGFNKITEVSTRYYENILEGKSGWYFREAILPYFETVRDVRRFINTLEFQTDILRKDGMLQANAADLMAMEVLRVFEPDVYDQIAGSKTLFTTDPRLLHDEGKSAQARLEVVIKPARRGDCVREIISRHFSNLAAVLVDTEKPLYGPSDADFAHLRVCHPDCFDRYFHLALPKDELSEKEAAEINALLSRQEALAERLVELHERGLLPELLNRWTHRSDLQGQEQIKQAFMALAIAVDKIPPPLAGAAKWDEFFVENVLFRVHEIAGLSADEPFREDTVAFALECANDSSSIFLPATIFITILRDLRGARRPQALHDAKKRDEEAVNTLCERMRAVATEVFVKHPRCARLLSYWAVVDGEDAQEVANWLNKNLTDVSHLSMFLDGLTRPFTENSKQIDAALVRDLRYLPLCRAVQKVLGALDRNALLPEQSQRVDAVISILNEYDARDPLDLNSQTQEN